MNDSPIRDAIVDGLFYPDDPHVLKADVSRFIAENPTERNDARAILVPHAGYQYVGPYLGCAFNAVSSFRPDRIVILAPAHREPETALFISESGAFRTPLGIVEVDKSLNQEIEDCSTHIITNDIPHLEEHCIEVQLPFIQSQFPGIPIIPILAGDRNTANASLIKRMLSFVFDTRRDSTLFVLSVNMDASIHTQDSTEYFMELLNSITACDIPRFENICRHHQSLTCGDSILSGFMQWIGDNTVPTVLRKGNSLENDPNAVETVYYASIGFFPGKPA